MRKRFLTAALALALCAVAAAQTRDPLPVPDVTGFKTLKCDFHMHTVFSDGEVWPTVRVTDAYRDGLDAIAITDHSEYHPHQKDLPYDGARPHAIAQALADQLGILLVPAIEVAQGDFHCNALFVKDQNALRGNDLRDVVRRARAQDAFVFWNHPGWKQKAEWFPLIASIYDDKNLQGMEIVNGGTFYPEAYPWIEEKKLTILADSDVHGVMPAGRTRPITLVFAKTADLPGIREALFARRTAAWMGGEVWGAQEMLEGLLAGALHVENEPVTARPGARVAMRVRNTAAFPVKLQARNAPQWFRMPRAMEIRPEAITGVPVTIDKNAPAGRQTINVEVEAVNFHVAPGRNFVIRASLDVDVR